MCFSNCFSCAIQDLHLFILYHECTNGTMPSTLLVLRTIPPTLRTFPPNRPKWVHFHQSLPHSVKKSPFPGIKKAGRERTLSGQMTPILHFSPSKGAFLSIQPYILTSYQSKHAKITTHASSQNLGGYMAPPMGIEPMILPWEGNVLTAWPWRLMAGELGFEPRQYESES